MKFSLIAISALALLQVEAIRLTAEPGAAAKPTVEEKNCASIPEIGPLPASEFGVSTKATTGLQTYCKKFQSEYQKLKGQDNAFDIAKGKTLDYYLEQGYTLSNT